MGAISVQGKAYLETFEGTMNAERYIEMLEERFIPVADDIMEESWTLQQDGAKAYIAKDV